VAEVKVPTAIAYLVSTPKGHMKVLGTDAYVEGGALVVRRPIFLDAEFTDETSIASHIFAPGKWIELEYLAGGYWPNGPITPEANQADETPAEPETPDASA
jgi:hypothetical protein